MLKAWPLKLSAGFFKSKIPIIPHIKLLLVSDKKTPLCERGLYKMTKSSLSVAGHYYYYCYEKNTSRTNIQRRDELIIIFVLINFFQIRVIKVKEEKLNFTTDFSI
jgi:hypothetical protein